MVGPPVGTRDRLRHQHVPLISPPDEDIVQQVPLTRPRMPLGGLLSLRQTEERVRQDAAVFCAGAVEEQAVVAAEAETIMAQHSSPGKMLYSDAGVEVTKHNQLVRLRHGRQEGVQVLVEIFSCGVVADHRQSSHDVVPDDEGDSRVSSPCPGPTTPEEGVAGTHLLQLALFGESSLAECGDVHLVARQFSGH
ncbi:hypothetical protein SprV_0702458200 [Sparganum proliferum]